jgi:acyl carrier protein
MEDHEIEIRKFIIDKFLFGEQKKIAGDLSLLDADIVDSMAVLELISYLEESFGIKVEDRELVPENLDTIDRLCAFLSKKLGR